MEAGDRAEAVLVVAESDTARAMSTAPGEEFPAVLATTRMIGLMEVAASRVMKPLLRAGQLSVGVGVDVRHLAATPVGAPARAVATFEGMEGKLYRFRVEAFDRGGLIGEGVHTRAIIDEARLVEGARSRNEGSSPQGG